VEEEDRKRQLAAKPKQIKPPRKLDDEDEDEHDDEDEEEEEEEEGQELPYFSYPGLGCAKWGK